MNADRSNDAHVRLRILRLCTSFMPPPETLAVTGARCDPVGGMQNHTIELTKSLDRLDVGQIVVSTRLPATAARQKLGRHADVIRLGIPINRLRQLYSVPAAGFLPRLASKADIVHAHLGEDLALLPLAVLTARLHRKPLVMTIHCSLRHTLEAHNLRTLGLTSFGGRLERWASEQAAGVIVLTDRLAKLMHQDGVDPEIIHVIPPGVDLALFDRSYSDPFPDLDGPLIVFVGRLVREKGVRVLAEAAGLLETSAARVVFVGDGPERAALQSIIARLGLENRVHITGFVPHDSIPSVLGRADIHVLPSLTEELGSVLLEGMQAGAAIVASRTGGIPTLVGHGRNGLLVPPGDPAQLAAALDRVLADPTLADRLRTAARDDVQERDWDAVADRVLGVYEGILASHSSVEAGQPVTSLS